MRPATRMSVRLERNRKVSTQSRTGENTTKMKEKIGKKRSNSEGGNNYIDTWTSMDGRCLFLFSHVQHAVLLVSNFEILDIEQYRHT